MTWYPQDYLYKAPMTNMAMRANLASSNRLKRRATTSVSPMVAAAGVAADEEECHAYAFLTPRHRLPTIQAWCWWLSSQAWTPKL